MRTILAFKFENNLNEQQVQEGIERVRNHYYRSINNDINIKENIVIHKNMGAMIFDLEDSPLLWEDVHESGDVSLITYAPPANWKRFSRTKDVKAAPKELLIYIMENKNSNLDFSAPACVVTIDKKNDEMNIFTDSIGFSRLYEFRGENGWFWSNRAGALTLFAGEKAEMNMDGWSSLCAAGWFINNTSPIDRVTRVEQGVTIRVTTDINKPRKHIDAGDFSNIVSPKPISELNLKKIAEDMKYNLESYKALWNLPLIVDLSGGKDSRVCAATVISSGGEDAEFRTVANYDDELAVAESLLQKVNLNHRHLIIDPSVKEDESKLIKNPIKERMKLLFHSTDGDFNPAIVQNDISEKSIYKYSSKLRIAGFLGEAAKPKYYDATRVKKLKKLKGDAAITRIKQTYFKYSSIQSDIQDKATEIIASSLQKGKNLGLHNIELLDYFYIAERGRRWPPQSNNIDRYSIFMSNEFLSQTSHMPLEERLNDDFFTEINKYLVPEWEGARYFEKTDDIDERSEKRMRLWQTSDYEGIEKILSRPKKWNKFFKEEEIKHLWEEAKNDNLANKTDAVEKLFYRVMMIDYYQDHLNRLNSFIED